jgi:hypothetical protein
MNSKTTFLRIFFLLFAVILPIEAAQAQTPDIFTGSIFWLRADTGVTHENGTVSNWKDQSQGSNKSAFQTLPISQPKYIADTINHFPAIRFDGRYMYMDCPSKFPVMQDYTVTLVTRINGFGRDNHLLSGNLRTFSISSSGYPVISNDASVGQLTSSIPLQINQAAIITVTFKQSTGQALMYVDGELAGSGKIGTNTDAHMYLGAFQGVGSNTLLGDIAEVVLFDSTLSTINRRQLEGFLLKKYAIPPPPAPDSIYTAIPKHLQFYARDYDDSATASISGIYSNEGYDSMYVKVFKNGSEISRVSHALFYQDGKAAFSFSPRIHAELSEYSFLLGVKSSIEDRKIAFSDSIVCGDVLLINGQSNSISNNLGYTNQYFRTFGKNFSQSGADTLWAISSTNINFGGGTEVGSWGLRLQELLMNNYHIPVCIINGGVGGTSIEQHLRDPLNHTNLLSIYGSMLYRVKKSGLAEKAKALFWYQGESNVITDYESNFHSLYQAWKEDFPNIQKIYVMQVRPGCSAGFSADVRDLLRKLQNLYPNIEAVSTMGIPGHDGCHFSPEGYSQLGDQLFRLLARDFYGAADKDQISSPDITQAYYTNSSHTEIGLTFSPSETRFAIPGDTTIAGITANIKDYFYLNDTGEVIESITSARNRIFLTLKQPSSARLLNYLPDKHYNTSTAIYEGPWLENTRGIGAFSFYHVPIVDSAQAGVTEKVGMDIFAVYPNPSSGKFTITYSLPQKQDVTITICDLLGRVACVMEEGNQEGTHKKNFDVSGFGIHKGMYFCKLQMGDIIKVIPLTFDN